MAKVWIHFILLLLMFSAMSMIFGFGVEGFQTMMIGYLLFDKVKQKQLKK
ncbi:MAG: hypothetical protein Q4A15_11500 [Prevotellaceae bacterium]|nr:hypothetical protein [Prevotellaceae bacterium]